MNIYIERIKQYCTKLTTINYNPTYKKTNANINQLNNQLKNEVKILINEIISKYSDLKSKLKSGNTNEIIQNNCNIIISFLKEKKTHIGAPPSGPPQGLPQGSSTVQSVKSKSKISPNINNQYKKGDFILVKYDGKYNIHEINKIENGNIYSKKIKKNNPIDKKIL